MHQPIATVGRHPRSDIYLDDITVSRLHAEFRCDRSKRLASEPRRAAPVDQATAIRAIGASPLPHLERCAAAYREEYGGIEYGGLPVAVNLPVSLRISSTDNSPASLLGQQIWRVWRSIWSPALPLLVVVTAPTISADCLGWASTAGYVRGVDDIQDGGARCQTVPGATVDAAVGQLLLDTLTPHALEVALTVQAELDTRA